ncbi:TPA: hypothetical protein H1Y76_000867 [Escherichia coli]|nr:hypothetical protein [Escherichia coli]
MSISAFPSSVTHTSTCFPRRRAFAGSESAIVAAATVSLAEQDAVEPQVSKGRCWTGSGLPVPVQHTSCLLPLCDSMRLEQNRQ